MRVAVYDRTSTLDQVHGLQSQVFACKKFIEEHKLEPEKTIIYEEQVSGRRSDRPVLRKLLHDGAMKKFQTLVVFKFDRLSRGGVREMLRVMDDLQKHGIRVYSVCDSWYDPDSPTAELVLVILAWAAGFESQSIGERVSAGIASRRAEAKEKGEMFLWGRARVSKIVLDPSLPLKAAQLRAQGLSWSRIAATLSVGRTSARRLCQIGQGRSQGVPIESGGGVNASNVGSSE